MNIIFDPIYIIHTYMLQCDYQHITEIGKYQTHSKYHILCDFHINT